VKVEVWVFWGGVFLGGCTQENPKSFFGYVPGCLNPVSATNNDTLQLQSNRL